eukprot:SAG25_NODE_276_length_10527_cov_19.954737_1_plen_142_part_00
MLLCCAHRPTRGGAAQARLGSDTLVRPSAWTHEDKQELARVVSEDPLYVLQDDEKELVFNLRYQCVLPAACVATILAPLSLSLAHSIGSQWVQTPRHGDPIANQKGVVSLSLSPPTLLINTYRWVAAPSFPTPARHTHRCR